MPKIGPYDVRYDKEVGLVVALSKDAKDPKPVTICTLTDHWIVRTGFAPRRTKSRKKSSKRQR